MDRPCEDVKEYYFYLDSTPTYLYMKYLYKYPQCPFPYADFVETNRGRGKGSGNDSRQNCEGRKTSNRAGVANATFH